ncbi:MAG: hypothetical protein HRU12_12975, partial [Phaeodactylibacter sp.]|nr:hypothetical protein [Phaeodactylibacter sp.]
DIEFLVQHTSSAGEGYQVDLAGLVFEGTYGTPLLISGLIWPLGTYAVDIMDIADPDCEVSSSFNITGCDIDCNTDDWNVVFTTIDPICFGSADGCASVEVLSGGAAPYIFTWSNGATTSNLCNLFEGVYAVTITDANGCEFSEQIFINEPIELKAFIQEEETPRCESSTDGVLSITIAGGSPPYTYVWSDGTFGGAMVGLSPGIYSVTAVDANGCAVTTSYNLQPELIADAGPAQELTCANSALVLDGSSSDTGPDITYDWTTLDGTIVSGFNTLNPIVQAPGTYILLVTDNSTPGCFSDDEVIVTENIYEPSIIADLISCDSADILFAPPLPGGLPTWTLPDGSMVANENPVGATQSGTYYLLLEDVINGCVFQDSLVVDLDPESCTTIAGRLVLDTLADCTPMPEEPGLSGWLIAIDSGDELYYAVTQANGHYEQQVPVGNYEVYPIMPATYWLACQDSYMVNLDEPGNVATLDIPVQEQETCPELTVDFSMPLMRACWTIALHSLLQ